MSRYLKRSKATNNHEMYDKLFEKRGVKKIVQYRSPTAKYVERSFKRSIETREHTWKQGDSFELLASLYYGDFRLWWVIAGFNNVPTENHLKYGDKIRVPLSLAEALQVVE